MSDNHELAKIVRSLAEKAMDSDNGLGYEADLLLKVAKIIEDGDSRVISIELERIELMRQYNALGALNSR